MADRFGTTVMYSQLQPWSMSGALPCMEPVTGPTVPPRVAASYQNTRPHPWRPTLAYELVENRSLQESPVTNQFVKSCFAPSDMETEPMTFPNLVTGFERNPQHAARAALYTRYTPSEWRNNNMTLLTESNISRNQSDRLRNDLVRLVRETEEKTTYGQRDAGRRLGERITDVTFWRNELNIELEHLIYESSALAELRQKCRRALLDLEAPLHIAQECLYQRERRSDAEKVHDVVEKALLVEIDNLRNSKVKLNDLFDKITKQTNDLQAVQHAIEDDVSKKDTALGIDSVCHQICNYSRGLTYYGGIEKYDPSISTQELWAEASRDGVSRSQAERAKLSQLRSDSLTLLGAIATSVWDYWNSTNSALISRAQEISVAKNKVQVHLQRTQLEIFDMEKHILLLRKAIKDKTSPLMVAQTRLEARTHRSGVELCKDSAQYRLVEEVHDIQGIVKDLHYKLQEAEAQHQILVKLRSTLETELRHKVDAVFIDREKCMGLRRAFPIQCTIKY